MNSMAVYAIDLPTKEEKEFYYFLTGNVHAAITKRLQQNLTRAGLNVTNDQWSLLYILWNEEGLTQQELAHRMFREKSTITRLINNLEQEGYVMRVTDKIDRRNNLIYLTDAGRELKHTCMIEANRTVEEALIGFDEMELLKIREILDRVYNNLS